MRKSTLKASDFTIVRSARRKRIAFSATPEGELQILAPFGVSDAELVRIALENQPVWGRLRRRAAARSDRRPKPSFTEGEEFFLWGNKYPLRFRHRLTAFDGAFIGEAETFAHEMRRFVEPKTGLLLERMRLDGSFDLDSQYGRFVNSGHAVEAMNFLFGHIMQTGNGEHLAFAHDTALRMFDFGWDAAFGGGFVYRDACGRPVDKTDWMLKTWWANCEAATAMLRGWRLTGDARFFERFRLVDAYDWSNFRDPDFSEWFAYAPVEGRRIHSYKGNVRKGFFHLPRRLLECCETLAGGNNK